MNLAMDDEVPAAGPCMDNKGSAVRSTEFAHIFSRLISQQYVFWHSFIY